MVILVAVVICCQKNWTRQGASIKIKHNTIRGPIKGRSQENKGLWNQDKKSGDWYWARRSLCSALRVFTFCLDSLTKKHPSSPKTTHVFPSSSVFKVYWSSIVEHSSTRKFICLWSDSTLSAVEVTAWSSLSWKSPARWWVCCYSSCTQRKGHWRVLSLSWGSPSRSKLIMGQPLKATNLKFLWDLEDSSPHWHPHSSQGQAIIEGTHQILKKRLVRQSQSSLPPNIQLNMTLFTGSRTDRSHNHMEPIHLICCGLSPFHRPLMPLTASSVHPATDFCWQRCRSIPLSFTPGPQNFTGSHPSNIPLFNLLSNYPVCVSSQCKLTHDKVLLISFFLGWCVLPLPFFGAFITLLYLPFAYLWWLPPRYAC